MRTTAGQAPVAAQGVHHPRGRGPETIQYRFHDLSLGWTKEELRCAASKAILSVCITVLRVSTRTAEESGVDGLSGDEGAFGICSFWALEQVAGH